jgi:hypothetical protein
MAGNFVPDVPTMPTSLTFLGPFMLKTDAKEG